MFQCDLASFRTIAQKLEIPQKSEPNMWYRHPLAFLTEAADDICYKIMDLEDGYKHNLVSYEETRELLMCICKMTPDVTNIDGLDNIKVFLASLKCSVPEPNFYSTPDPVLAIDGRVFQSPTAPSKY